MANFAKYAGQDTKGWDPKATKQTLGIGSHADIALSGGGPGGVDLQVSAADPSICSVHEKRRPATGWRTFVMTALQMGTTEIRAVLPGSAAVWASMQVAVIASSTGVRLVFFPGERLAGGTTLGAIYVIGGHGERFAAAGGPPAGGIPDRGGHVIDSTPAGHYTLGAKHHVTTVNWPMSTISFGADLRLAASGEVEFKDDRGAWKAATGPHGVVTAAQLAFVRRDGGTPDPATIAKQVRDIFVNPATGALWATTWQLNDFGRWGWNLRRAGKRTAYFIHTTPDDELATAAGRAVFLANSHGCVHIAPSDRDKMIAAGYLKEGIDFEVRSYSETGPP